MINHEYIIQTVIEHNGLIIGSYIREWIANGKPVDWGWRDIDILCPQKEENIIAKEIYKKEINVNLDFRANTSPNFRSKYTSDLAFYDGISFKIRDPYKAKEEEYLELTKNKVCRFLGINNCGRNLTKEEYLIKNGWEIQLGPGV